MKSKNEGNASVSSAKNMFIKQVAGGILISKGCDFCNSDMKTNHHYRRKQKN